MSSENSLINPNRFTDSAGVPWAGREFEPNPFIADDGAMPEPLGAALANFPETKDVASVVRAISKSRLLVPLLAQLGESEIGAHGHTVEKSAELALITVSGPDGAPILPVFSSVSAMKLWNPEARPVPIEARRIALATVSDGTNRLVLDPKSDHAFVVRRPALAAIAQEIEWIPPHLDAALTEKLSSYRSLFQEIIGILFSSGDPDSKLAGAELLIQLKLEPGLTRHEVSVITQALSLKWSELKGLNERIDSVQIQVTV